MCSDSRNAAVLVWLDFLKLPKSRQMKSFKATDAAFQFGLQEKGNKK